MMKTRTWLVTALVALLTGKVYTYSMQETCSLLCNDAHYASCTDQTTNYVGSPSVGRLCCITSEIPSNHSLTVDYSPYINENIYSEILNWRDTLPDYAQAFFRCIRDCSRTAPPGGLTNETCFAFIRGDYTCESATCP